jgi:alpha-tubulin suppressor-like RCC1 family protein
MRLSLCALWSVGCGGSVTNPGPTDASAVILDSALAAGETGVTGSAAAVDADIAQPEVGSPADSAAPADAAWANMSPPDSAFEACPAAPSGPAVVAAVSAGARHSCVLRPCGEVRCWGWNGHGELGNGTKIDSSTPVPVVELGGIKAVAAGGWHSCALDSGGDVYCWGYNDGGQLGNGTTVSTSRPVRALGVSDATAIVAGGSSGSGHTCAIVQGGRVVCWGDGGFGQLGQGAEAPLAGGVSSTPVSVVGVTSATALSAGTDHTCALLASGSIQCWGSSLWGERGDGTTQAPGSAMPTLVAGISEAVAITAGGNHTCAALKNGAVKCWGPNSVGELGTGHVASDSPTPVDVVGLTEAVTTVAAGGHHTCAVGASGSLFCWGFNSEGQLGVPRPLLFSDVTPTTTPIQVPGVSDAVAVTAGDLHTCVRLKSGLVNCWGAVSIRDESQPPVVVEP